MNCLCMRGILFLIDRRCLHFRKFSLIEQIPSVFKFASVTMKMSRSYTII